MPWERTPWHRSKHVKFGPSWLFHKGLSFSAQLANCNVGPCWHVKAHIGACLRSAFLHLSFIPTMASVVLSSSFIWKLPLGWPWANLGRCMSLLAQPQKNTDVHKGMLPWEGLPRQTCINHLRRNKDVNSWIKFRLHNNSFAPALGGAYAGGTNTIALIQTS